MSHQASLFDFKQAEDAKQDGITTAVNHANDTVNKWSNKAYQMFIEYLANINTGFMGEDFRRYAEQRGLQDPPSKRAFGGVILRASKEKLITKIGHAQVSNVRAHKAFASIWKKVE